MTAREKIQKSPAEVKIVILMAMTKAAENDEDALEKADFYATEAIAHWEELLESLKRDGDHRTPREVAVEVLTRLASIGIYPAFASDHLN